jgi:ABC-type branched-subunit amino acid transport system ATPase component/branched-subunit amino acid ABC-type transport system permease component
VIYERFAILGLATGSLYALTALGIVLVSRVSGVINFASGAMGAAGAYLAYDLRDTFGVPTVIAMALGVALGAVLGMATQLIVMTLLRRTAPLSKLIATLGILTILQGAISLIWGQSNRGQPASMLPTSSHQLVHGLFIPEDRLWLIGISLVAAFALKLVYTRTSFGLATAAVAEDRQVAAICGLSATRIELINFAIAGAISAAAAILLAPILSLDISALVIIVIPALAAALIGRFSAFGITVGAALLIGVVQAEIPHLGFVKGHPDSLAGLPDAVPVVLIVIVTAIRGRGRLQRGEIISRLPLPGTGRVNVPLLAAATAAGLLITSTSGGGWTTAIIITIGIAILVLSVVVVTGYAGQVSLAQFAIAGFGLWVAARLYDTHGFPFPLALLCGVAAAVPVGLVVALPALRARGVDLAVATLGLALTIQDIVLGNTSLTGGFGGTDIHGATLFGWSIDGINHPGRYASVSAVGFLMTGLVVANLRRGRGGRRLLAVRSNERAAASLGVGVYGAKLYAFGLSAAIAGFAGVVLGFKDQNAQFNQFDIFGSITAVQYAVIGGLGMAGGAIIGATLAAGAVFAQLVSDLVTSTDITLWVTVAAGLTVIAIIGLAPDGLAPRIGLLGRWLPHVPARAARADQGTESPRDRTHAPLELRGVTVRFGGVVALDDVSFTVHPGEVLGLIGPNGAGKTTLLDVATGFTRQSAGSLLLDGNSITRWSPERRAREGLGRSFQAVELFEELTVRDNLLVAADRKAPLRYLVDLLRPGIQPPSEAMRAVVSSFELSGILDRRPSQLSQGQARLVGIARAMCAEPTLLFLDEPAAGLDSHERTELGEQIRSLATEHGIGVVLVEHDVPLVMATCDRVVALDSGRLIAQGTPAEIRQNAAVVASYLGEEPHAEAATPSGGPVGRMVS